MKEEMGKFKFSISVYYTVGCNIVPLCFAYSYMQRLVEGGLENFLYLEIPCNAFLQTLKKIYHFDNLILQKDKVRVFLQESVIAAYIQDLVFNYCYTL